ncbi:MAG: class I SAM-dependent methyltransferase [Ruminococcus sp.]|nr:class I SAM-dependent methyltransferase [Ruminococcus sp.]
MRMTDRWKDYRILDAAGGEKLESWGGRILVRPDPQIIWKSPKRTDMWDKADAVYHRSSKGGGSWEYRSRLPESWKISYGELNFIIRPTGFKHTGLFPEQAVNWDLMAEKIRTAGRPVKVLNLFAYTGGATLACAKAGASVSHVDASKGMVAWARENAAASGLEDRPIRWLTDDCEKFVKREIRRGNYYDAVVMDPPSYGRGPGGEVWKLEDCIYDLVKTCSQVLSDKPLFFLLNSYTTGLSPSVMAYILKDVLCRDLGGRVSADEIGLPVESVGGALPCGSTAIWEND